MQLQTCCKGSVRCIILLLLVLLHTGAFAARKPYSNTVFGFDKGSITNGVFKVTDSNTGTEMTVTNASSVTYYNPSRQNYYKPYLRLKNKGETTITFTFTDPTLSLRAISYETNSDYNSWFGAYNNTYAFGAQYTTGIENFTHSNDGLTWTCTFSGVDNIQILSVGLWWDPVEAVKANPPTGVTKTYTGTMQSLFELSSTYYAKSGQGNGEMGYKCKYNKGVGTALNMRFAGGQGTNTLDKGYASEIGTYTMKWWYEGNSFKYSDVDVIYSKDQGSEDSPLGTFESKITPMATTGVIEPSAKLLDYTGEPQPLITAASSPNGKAYYRLNNSENAAWTEEIPTGTDAGDYSVSWYIKSTNSAYDDIGSQLAPNGPIVVTILKVDIPGTPTNPTPLTPIYNGDNLLLATGGSATGGEIWFRVGEDGNWTQTPMAKAVGYHIVYWYVKGDDNHNNLGSEETPYSSLTAQIQRANYDMSEVKWSPATFTYDGTAKQGEVTVSTPPSPDISIIYTYKDANNHNIEEAINAGTYTVTATFSTSSGNYVDPAPMTTTFTIEPFNLQGAHVTGEIAAQEYTGAAINPITEQNHPVLSLSTDNASPVIPFSAYTTTYLNNINAGTNTATATMTANNSNPNYVGSRAVRFSITKKSVQVSTAAQSITYGESISSDVSKAALAGAVEGHVLSAVTLTPYQAYGVGTHEKAIMASDAHISDGSGKDVTSNYSITYPIDSRGTLTVNVKSGSGFTVSGLQAEYEGNGTDAVTPASTNGMNEVAIYDGSTKLTNGTDYEVTYENNTLAGTATATFTLKGNYTGSITKNFVIYYVAETYNRPSASQYNYCTYYHPTEALQADAAATVYYCTINNAKTEVVLNEVANRVINVGTPVMLCTPSTIKFVKLYKYSGAAATYSGTNALTGVATDQVGTTVLPASKTYIFDGDNFVWATSGTLTAHKAYIDGSGWGNNSARQLTIVFADNTTGINNVSDNFNDNDVWYDLQGRKLDNKPIRKGLYFLNGNKVVVK